MGDQISQRRARPPNKEAENLALHVRQVVPTLLENPVLLRPEKMQDGVDGPEHVIGNFVGVLVEFSHLHASDVDIINKLRRLRKSYFDAGVQGAARKDTAGIVRASEDGRSCRQRPRGRVADFVQATLATSNPFETLATRMLLIISTSSRT